MIGYSAFTIISSQILLRMRNVSDRCCREIQNTHFIFQYLFPDSSAVYEIMWKNMARVGQVTADNIL